MIRGQAPRSFNVLNRKWLIARDGSIYHYADFDPARNQLSGLSVFEINVTRWQMAARTFAGEARFDRRWDATRGWVRKFSDDGTRSAYEPFARRALVLEPPDYFTTEKPDAERMTYVELKRYISELSASGLNIVPYAVALERKISFPFVTVIMTLLGVPFAVTTGRRGAMYGIGAGLVLAFSYWIVLSVFGAIGSAGLVAPVLAAWAPNIMMLAAAGYMLLSVRT
jgi:lipopolysaccharide export LptBFGC system permease protein LptF